MTAARQRLPLASLVAWNVPAAARASRLHVVTLPALSGWLYVSVNLSVSVQSDQLSGRPLT